MTLQRQLSFMEQISQTNGKPGDRITGVIEGVVFPFRWCPPGNFVMGSPESEPDRSEDEIQHKVQHTRGFWLMETPVTQEMYQVVTGTNPSEGGDDRKKYPVDMVTWGESMDYCTALTDLFHLTGWKVSLPTEAQWEYACRAGSTGSFGGSGDLNEHGWYFGRQHGKDPETHEVAQLQPNAWGFYDMHGNVCEWCVDFYDIDYYKSSPECDPTGAETGDSRVVRGGSSRDIPCGCRCAARIWGKLTCRQTFLGFRPVIVQE